MVVQKSSNTGPEASIPAAGREESARLKLVRHYDFLYWWLVWLYAAFAALLTAWGGVSIQLTDKLIKIYPDPVLGIGFVVVFLFVAIFTTIRARGAMSAILVLCLVMVGAGIYFSKLWGLILDALPSLRIHMNLAFYVSIFLVLGGMWLLSTFVFNRIHYYTFGPGATVGDRRLIGGGSKDYRVHAVEVHRLPDDIFVHRVLGLWWLRGGTGDLRVSFRNTDGASVTFEINNVWRPERKKKLINEILGGRSD